MSIQIEKVKEEPKLPPLKFAYQHIEHHKLEDQPMSLKERRLSIMLETVSEATVRDTPKSKVSVR